MKDNKKVSVYKRDRFSIYKSFGKVYCPAFRSYVYFTLLGWEHLVGSGGNRKRSWSDVYRRLQLLPFAKRIVQKSHTIQNIKTVRGKTFYALDSIEVVQIKKKKVTTKVRVVILDTKTGKKFYSVMDRKMG